jgi:hypothetical protein
LEGASFRPNQSEAGGAWKLEFRGEKRILGRPILVSFKTFKPFKATHRAGCGRSKVQTFNVTGLFGHKVNCTHAVREQSEAYGLDFSGESEAEFSAKRTPIPATDFGLDSRVHPQIASAKLRALHDGASSKSLTCVDSV